MEDLVGKSFGPYRVLEKVGEGGMAVVYKGYQESLGRYVAIKVLRTELARDEEFVNRFRREALAVAQLDHPNILHVYDAGVAHGVYYMVMGFVDGGSLKDLIAQGPLDPEYAVGVASQLADALDYAHQRGLIHRDVKPSNVLITRDGRPLLTDFGIAKALYESASLTRTGATIGTPEYMAPEQIQGQPVDARTDLYSLGIVLYEMLTGWAPFSTTTPVATLYKQVNEIAPPMRQVNVKVPEWLDGVVGKVLAKRPEARYQTGGELADALRRREGPQPVAVSKTPPASKKAEPPRAVAHEKKEEAAAPTRKGGLTVPLLLGAISLVLLALVAGGAYLVFGGGGEDRPTRVGSDVVTMVVTSNQVAVVTQVVTTEPEPTQVQVAIASPAASRAVAEPSNTPASGGLTGGAGATAEQPSPTPEPSDTPIPAPTATPTPQSPTAVPTKAPAAVPTAKPAPTKAAPAPTRSTCPAWYQKPEPGKGVLLVENHMGAELLVEWIAGGTGNWRIPPKQGDVPGRLLLQLPPGHHEFRDQVPNWGGGYIKLDVVAGKSYISPIWDNSRADELVYPYDPPAGCK